MKTLVDEAMKDGAFGLSSLLAMPPGSLATTDDIVELCKVVAKHGGIFSTHIRNEGTGVFDAVKEAIAVGERAGVPVDIIHLKIADQKLLGPDERGRRPDRRRPASAASTCRPTSIPTRAATTTWPASSRRGPTRAARAKMLERLKDAKQRERMKKDIKEGMPGWYNHYTAVGGDWSRMLVSGKGRYEGLTMDRVIAVRTQGQGPAARRRWTCCSTC